MIPDHEIVEGQIVEATANGGRLVRLANGQVVKAVLKRTRQFGCLFGDQAGWKVKVALRHHTQATIVDLTMPRDDEHSPDPNANTAKIVAKSTATQNPAVGDVEAAWLAWSGHIQNVDECGMTLLRAAFEGGYGAGQSSEWSKSGMGPPKSRTAR